MILDLKTFVDETLDIHTADGKTLHLPKPSQAMVIKILNFRDIDENTPEKQADEALTKMATEILNSNIDGVKFKEENVAAMHETTRAPIVMTYADFMARLQSNPITPYRACQKKRGIRAAIRNFFRGSGK